MTERKSVADALEDDLKALETAGKLKENTSSVQSAMRVLAKQIDAANVDVREKTAALKELRAALEDVRTGGSGRTGQTFRERVAAAGAPPGNAPVRHPKYVRPAGR